MATTIVLKVSPETKEALKQRKHPGQTFDGVIQELLQMTAPAVTKQGK